MKKYLLMMAFVAVSIAGAQAQITITQWDFNNITPGDLTTATPSIGNGSLTLIGGTTHPATGFSGNGSSDPTAGTNRAFQTTTYPAQGTASGTAGVRFNVSTSGYSSPTYSALNIFFDLRLSNTSSRWYRLDYTTDGGTNWTLGSATRLGTSANAGDTWFNNNSVTISDTAALNNANFGFRVVSVFSPISFIENNSTTSYGGDAAYEVARNTTSNYGGGTWRFDMVTVQAVPEPATWASLLCGLTTLVIFRRRFKN